MKTLRKADHVRQYTIRFVDCGWEVRAEQDSKALHRALYDDWHRVERARRSILQEMQDLTSAGWTEDTAADQPTNR